ncbi:uncharacterized protein LOC127001691 isoform X2 [Eriocheir sinensis]|uniref:uncharacterized protein LOC127001691 isoform X2 n=1 Tax=Eriocheir sinensis TaxID=95602 RepID=UPI0021C6CAFA|nr:uncharacterized protein LOC127001691 isoform X2 [Eriocheir sinensis]
MPAADHERLVSGLLGGVREARLSILGEDACGGGVGVGVCRGRGLGVGGMRGSGGGRGGDCGRGRSHHPPPASSQRAQVRPGLRMADTCGLEGQSVKAAVQAWAADAFTCPQPVFTLGYLGPGDTHSASAVSRAMHTLGTPVVAYGPRSTTGDGPIDLVSPAPYRSMKAVAQMLIGAGVQAVSVVHTADPEGKTLSEYFVMAAEYVYVCVDTVLKEDDSTRMAALLRPGPGTIVILGTRHRVQRLAQVLGQDGGPAEVLVLVETGGPVPQVELAKVDTPTLLLQRMAPVLSEFQLFLERDMGETDSLRRRYLAAVSDCATCSGYFGYDAAAPAAIAAVLMYVEALRKAKTTHCQEQEGFCPALKALEASVWRELLTTASLQEVAKTAFPELLQAGLEPGNEDMPRYRIKLLKDGNLTQVGQADEASAVMGLIEPLETRCSSQCPCHPVASNPPSTTGLDIMGGAEWWDWRLPNTTNLSGGEMAAYATAFSFLILVFLSSSMICIYNIIKSPRRN